MVYFVGLFLRLGHANSLTTLELGFPIAFLICAILRSILIFSLAFYYANFLRTWEIKLVGHFLSQIREKNCSSLTHDFHSNKNRFWCFLLAIPYSPKCERFQVIPDFIQHLFLITLLLNSANMIILSIIFVK